MTLDQAEAARRRAVQMFERFGDPDSAAEFDSLTAEQYAERQGIEIVASNPGGPRRRNRSGVRPQTSTRERKITDMAKGKRTEELEDTVRDIYDLVQESGSTRADMEETLDKIAGLCTDAVPELDESEGEEDSENSEDSDEDEE